MASASPRCEKSIRTALSLFSIQKVVSLSPSGSVNLKSVIFLPIA
eukprot:UN24002